MEKLVSVIITTYGRNRDLITEAINSVRNQTYKNIEIIVVDDNGMGSEIQLQNEEYFSKEKDIIYIANEKNSGAQVSRNAGILSSRGDYIACLDDDDIWDSEKIKKQVALMETENLGLVYCNGYRFYNNDTNNKRLYQNNFISDRDLDFITELRSDHIGSTSIPLMKKTCLAKTGLFDVRMPARQDYEMWLRFCKYYRVKGIDEPLFYYRYHEGERITKSYDKEIQSYLLLWNKYKDEYKKDALSKAGILFVTGKTYFKAHKVVKALIYGLRAFFSSPRYVIGIIIAHRKQEPLF